VPVTIFSTLAKVTQATDPISSFGDQSNGAVPDVPVNAIDGTTASTYQNGGSGLNTQAGFPPFAGPAGLIVTPAGGPSLVSALRLYTAASNTERDPADYTLEGSNNGGSTYTVIASGALSLPLDRNSGTTGVDPLGQAVQEVRFSNNTYYKSYRITFNNVRLDANANSLWFSEMELLGVVRPILTFSVNPDHTITLTPSWPGELQSTTRLKDTGTVWVDEGPINQGGIVITPSPSTPQKYYRVQSF
jgi:hypothetical protein